jgi:hypothetical protein
MIAVNGVRNSQESGLGGFAKLLFARELFAILLDDFVR